MHLRDTLVTRYAEMVYNGYWFSPERDMLQALVDEGQKNVNGVVRLKLYKGNCTVVGRKSDRSFITRISPLLRETRSTTEKTRKGLSG